MAVPIGVPGVGVWGRVEGGGGGAVFLWKIREKHGKAVGRVGGGIGTGKGTGKSMRKLCRNYPLAVYPLVSPLNILEKWLANWSLVAPYRAILRYYRCDAPYRAIPFLREVRTPPKCCDTPLGT